MHTLILLYKCFSFSCYYFIYFPSPAIFYISLPSFLSRWPSPLEMVKNLNVTIKCVYLHFYFCRCITLVSFRLNAISFHFHFNDEWHALRIALCVSICEYACMHDNTCHKMHAFALWKYAERKRTKTVSFLVRPGKSENELSRIESVTWSQEMEWWWRLLFDVSSPWPLHEIV